LIVAPQEGVVTVRDSQAIVMLPMPDGTLQRFAAVESSILAPELQKSRPNIRTYLAQGLDDGAATARVTLTPSGFHALLFFPDRTVAIQQVDDDNATDYVSYFTRDRKSQLGAFSCTVLERPDDAYRFFQGPEIQLETGRFVRSYRLIVSATGELTTLAGGVAKTEELITRLVNGANGIFERDFNLRIKIERFNIFADSATDPFQNGGSSSREMLDENIKNLNEQFGADAYDVGHVFCPGGAGIAYVRSTCTNLKGGGASGATGDTLDYHIGVLSHELGHQFGADHSYDSTFDLCRDSRIAESAYEPGSGTTIMAYPGICQDDNVEDARDLYFHTHSYSQVQNWRQGTGGTCGTETATNNNPPSVNAGSDYTIPRETPFILTMTSSDADGDTLTHVWEQYDRGDDDSTKPLFRSLRPAASKRRFMPKLETVLANRTREEKWEKLPIVNRRLTFRATARDNRAGAGGVNFDTMEVTVNGAPFVITSPNNVVTWRAGTQETVTWDRGGGAIANRVDILLSLSGGTDFPDGPLVVLASDTLNDGAEQITVPSVTTSRARVFVRPTDNIFYDVSNRDFRIVPGDFQFVTPIQYETTRGVEIGQNNVQKLSKGDDADPVIIQQRLQPTPRNPNTELISLLELPAGQTPSEMTLVVRVAGNPEPLQRATREIAVYNWRRERFEVVSTKNPMTSRDFETVETILDPQLLKDFVDGAGRVRVAVRMYQTNPTFLGWTMRVSLVQIDYKL
jgi:hypothetical protein